MGKSKDFSNLQDFNNQISNAAMNVLGIETEQPIPAAAAQPEEDQSKKSKRFNFMVKPATYKELKAIAEDLNVSIGSLLNLIITDYLKKRKEQ